MSSLKDCVDALCRALKKETARIEALELKPSFKSKIINNNDGTYTHSDGAGVSGIIDLRPSDDGCNGIALGVDHRPFSEDHGYRIARTWQQVINLIAAGEDVLICQELQLDQDTTLGGSGVLRFVKDGAIDLNGFSLRLDVLVLNPNNRWIFKNVVLDETYPARWTGLGSTLMGTFGGESVRKAAWWGIVHNDQASSAALAEREQNNHAIAAAALSQAPIGTGAFAPVTVKLDRGWFAIHRTIRLDGIQCRILGDGHGQAGTRIVCDSDGNVVPFDTSHFIETFKFPGGTTPVIEIGYEIQAAPATNPDEGFRCGVEEITLRLPVVAQDKPISGIMWESGLQEGSALRRFSVVNYSGYAVGCPEEQTISHNVGDNTFVFPQVNSVLIEEFNIADVSPVAPEAIGIAVFGLRYTIRNGTVSHNKIEMLAPAMYIGTRETAIVEGVHLECRPALAAAYSGAALVIEDFAPGNVNVGAMTINSIMGFFSSAAGVQNRTVWTDAANVAFNMQSIRINRIPDANNATIEDASRGVMATSNVQAGVTSGYTALYARTFNADEAAYRVVTTDFGLL